MKQEEWAKLKATALAGFTYREYRRRAKKQSGAATFFEFLTTPTWNNLHREWYCAGIKTLPTSLHVSDLSDLALATWFMDDGSLTASGAVVICSENFTREENLRLIGLMAARGVSAKLQHSRRTGKSIWRIYIGNGNRGKYARAEGAATKFFRRIAPYMPPCMRYKLPAEIDRAIPFERRLWDIGTSIPYIAEVEVSRGSAPANRPRKLKFVYCLDVEETHNFVAKGLILHNCTATNIPLLWMGARILFADVDPETLCISPESVASLVNERTRAIVAVHYGGNLADVAALAMHKIPVIQDAAQALGVVPRWTGMVCYSFQAVKHITTGDGGMLVLPLTIAAAIWSMRHSAHDQARRLRWFGIDRQAKLAGIWRNDITEIGYKYQMTDIAAALGIAALPHFQRALALRRSLLAAYHEGLHGVSGVRVVGRVNEAAWLATVIVDGGHRALKLRLAEYDIESDQVHYRNDRYSIFAEFREPGRCPNMDRIENDYLCLPLHPLMTIADVDRVCDAVREFRK